jgi:hypothetical protein
VTAALAVFDEKVTGLRLASTDESIHALPACEMYNTDAEESPWE